MQNIGFMTKTQVNTIIRQFPNNATIKKTDLTIKVFAPNGNEVFSAANMSKMWHVRAMKGLIQQA